MINVEDIIGNILQPLRTSDDIGFYHYGNQYELKEVFSSKHYNAKYPFVWLVMPFTGNPTESLDKKQVTLNIRLLLVTGSKLEWLNDKRNIETFGKVLNPLYDKIVKEFTQNLQIQIINNEINVKKLHNYFDEGQGTRSNPSKRNVLDYCDVIQMEFNAIISKRSDCDVITNPAEQKTTVLIINGQVLVIGNTIRSGQNNILTI